MSFFLRRDVIKQWDSFLENVEDHVSLPPSTRLHLPHVPHSCVCVWQGSLPWEKECLCVRVHEKKGGGGGG